MKLSDLADVSAALPDSALPSAALPNSAALDQAALLVRQASKMERLAHGGATSALVVHDILMLRRLECVLDLASEANADVLVIDLGLGEALPGPATAPNAERLVLSDDPTIADDPALAGVLPRTASLRQIAAAVAAVAEGLVVRDGRVPRGSLREIAGIGDAPAGDVSAGQSPVGEEQAGEIRPGGRLTPREAEILTLIGRGMSNKAIARFLGISAHTVKYHLEAVFAKLGVRSRAEAATQGMRRGLVVF